MGSSILKRSIPNTGEHIPAVGLGTYNAFDTGTSESARKPVREVLRLFVEAGGNVVDTSPMYGSAEEVVGEVAAELGVRRSLFLATKVWTTGREAGIRQMETSLQRMHTDRIDLMQVHNLVDWETQLKTLRGWKEQGRVRYVGITHYSTGAFDAIERIMKAEKPDFIQIYYSLVTRQAEERLLPMAADLGVAVIVNRPLETSGLFNRIRGKRFPEWAREFECASWAQFFLKFVLSHPSVTCVIPATNKPEHLADNMRAGFGRLPDADMRKKMAEFMRREV